MIRPLTCICLLLAGGSGLYLYQSKHRAQMLDREIEHTLKATDVARARIGVLRGEWALLNEPERLAALSQSHLGLKSLAPSQFVTAAELGARLPLPAAPGTVYSPGEEEPSAETADALPLPPAPAPAAPPVPARPASAAAKAPSALPAASPRPPAQLASILQMPPSPLPPPRPVPAHPVLAPVVNVSASSVVPSSAPKPAPAHPAASASAGAAPPTALARPSTPTPAGMSIGESVARMARLHGGAQAAAIAGPAPQPVSSLPASNQASPSALGGTRPSLPPPVPFGSALAASVASAR